VLHSLRGPGKKDYPREEVRTEDEPTKKKIGLRGDHDGGLRDARSQCGNRVIRGESERRKIRGAADCWRGWENGMKVWLGYSTLKTDVIFRPSPSLRKLTQQHACRRGREESPFLVATGGNTKKSKE